jgi:acyl-CoA thioester hydrolase
LSGATKLAAKLFTWPVRVYWEDTDAGGIVFYANYLKFMERARTEWLRSLGVAQSVLRNPPDGQVGGMFVVRSTQLDYLQPARLDDQLLVTAHIAESTRITLTIAQEIRLLPTGNMLNQLLKSEHLDTMQQELNALPMVCSGQIRIAWVDAQHFRPSRIPQHVMEILQ